MIPKPRTCKAKTMKVGPDAGLVTDPRHPRQATFWQEAIRQAESPRQQQLIADREKALNTWDKYWPDMETHGYAVDAETGRIIKHALGEDGHVSARLEANGLRPSPTAIGPH